MLKNPSIFPTYSTVITKTMIEKHLPHDPPGQDPYLVSSSGLGVPNCMDFTNQEYTRDNDRKGPSISYR